MIVSSKDLLRYLPSMNFPVDILAEKDDRVMFRVTQDQLLALIATNGVVGIGSHNRIKRLRVNKLIAPQAERVYRESRYSRENLKLTYREKMERQPYTLKRPADGGGFERWPDDARFTPGRFNPDAIPAPLIPFRDWVPA